MQTPSTTLYINPEAEQASALLALPDDGPIWMLNLMKFKTTATYEDGTQMTGAEAYELYEKEGGPIFYEIGGTIVARGNALLTVVGPQEESWDMVILAQYPNKQAFLSLTQREDYQIAVVHRSVAIENSRLICINPNQA